MSNTEYNSSNIQVLEGLEAVRKRPGMYIGTTSGKGLHHLVWEIVDNSVDEHLAGYCNEILVTIHKDDSITVVDNGRGIPVDEHHQYKKPAVEVVLTVLHAGGKFGGGGYKVSGGLHGVGSSVVNALSKNMTVKVKSRGKIHEIKFQKGTTVQPLTVVGVLENESDTGTIVHFAPDDEIFKETTAYDFKTITARMRESAFLNEGLTIVITDEREIDPDTNEFLKETYCYHGGLVDYVKFLNESKKTLHEDVFYVSETQNDVEVNVALQYTDSYSKDAIFSYVNNVKTPGGGAHETGFKAALTACIKEYITLHELIKGEELPSGEDMRVGLTAVISVKVPEPQFEGQTKDKLGNSEVAPIVNTVIQNNLSKFLAEKPRAAEIIINKIVAAFKERMALRKAREELRKKNEREENEALNLPTKLADCSSKIVSERELFIVEGDSAGGSAKQARDRVTQAILPLRGKILNVEKATFDKINMNKEIEAIRESLGTDMGDDFNYEKRRYDKVNIMTDADVDGAHIRTLLLTFFYRYMRPLIENGNVYIAKSPLFKLERGKTIRYAFSEKERDEILAEFGEGAKVNIQRYKGLGEMNPKQLRETTMDIQRRTLIQVTLDDAAEAETLFHKLMGDESHLRKEFIRKNGHKANVDA